MISRSYKGHTFILVLTDKVPSFMVTIPIHHGWSDEIGDALIKYEFSKYSIPGYMIIDQIRAFMSTLINY